MHAMLLGALSLFLAGCADEVSSTSSTVLSKSDDLLAAKRKSRAKKSKAKKNADVAMPGATSDRPVGREQLTLTREDFSGLARDPFQHASSGPVKAISADLPSKRQREVRFAGYPFHDLRLIAIVRSSRSIPPRALFVAPDGVSKSIHQGEYFSRNEILLASVNSDYVEIEIIDEELARGLNMEQGERRAIYLKQN